MSLSRYSFDCPRRLFKQTTDKRVQLEQKSSEYITELTRTEKVLESLEGKDEEWTNKMNDLENSVEVLPGNMLLLAGNI